MQIFITSLDLANNARQLDKRRLLKQLIEADTILRINFENDNRAFWFNHPITKLYKKYPQWLIRYLFYIIEECRLRGIKLSKTTYQQYYDKWRAINKSLGAFEPVVVPPHLTEEFLKNMRKTLLIKGENDSICAALKKGLKIRNINNWLKDNEFPDKPSLNNSHLDILEKVCKNLGIEIKENWYKQFNWQIN